MHRIRDRSLCELAGLPLRVGLRGARLRRGAAARRRHRDISRFLVVSPGAFRVEVVAAFAFDVVGTPVPVVRDWCHPGNVLAAVDVGLVDVDDHPLLGGAALSAVGGKVGEVRAQYIEVSPRRWCTGTRSPSPMPAGTRSLTVCCLTARSRSGRCAGSGGRSRGRTIASCQSRSVARRPGRYADLSPDMPARGPRSPPMGRDHRSRRPVIEGDVTRRGAANDGQNRGPLRSRRIPIRRTRTRCRSTSSSGRT
ncbi:hypothetical protein M2275_006832 [Rhodococcus opacus]|nr:hypothetical protein [Rhodococcus opacus]